MGFFGSKKEAAPSGSFSQFQATSGSAGSSSPARSSKSTQLNGSPSRSTPERSYSAPRPVGARSATGRAIVQQQPQKNKARRCSAGRVWQYVLAAGQVAAAVALIIVIASCLQQTYPFTTPANLQVTANVCYATTSSLELCWYGYWAAALSIVLSIALVAFQLLAPRRRHVCCLTLESLLALVGVAWWAAAATTTLVYAGDANDAGLPEKGCRTASWVVSYALCVLFLLSFLSSVFDACLACCRRRRGDNDDPLLAA